MKRSTRRALAIEARAHRDSLASVERYKLARYALTSVAQGDPTTTLSLAAILMGAAFKVGGALASRETGGIRALEGPLRDTGTALWAVAAVNEGGSVIHDIATAMRGQQRVPVTYDVTDTPHTLSTSVTSTNTGSSLLPKLPPVPVPVPLPLVPPTVPPVVPPVVTPSLIPPLVAGGGLQAGGVILDESMENGIRNALESRGVDSERAAQIAEAATINRLTVPTPTDLATTLIEWFTPGGAFAHLLSGGRTASGGGDRVVAYLDDVPYYSEQAVNDAITALTRGGQYTVTQTGTDSNGRPILRRFGLGGR